MHLIGHGVWTAAAVIYRNKNTIQVLEADTD
jgi:hypothetical protein